MPVAKHASSDTRIIAHIDMDCFYVQVEQRKQPELRGVPTAVVQYNSWKGGGLIAVGYEARKCGVKRSMRGEEAKHVCPQIQLVQVPVARGKADLNIYRNAGSEVVSILARRGRCERASIDEVYLDLTDAAETMLAETPPESLEAIDEEALKSHVLGLDEDGCNVKQIVKEWLCRSNSDRCDKLLACGALIVAELRMQVLKETEFTCSAGIAHNKMLAKLASGMNKPAQQTVVPFSSVKNLLDSLPVKKMKQLGGKLGSSLQSELGVNTVGDLLHFSEEKLQECYGINTGTWLWNTARGISGEEVQGRLLPKSHGSGKTFPGPRALKTIHAVQHWLNELCEELYERLCSDLDQNKRIAHTLTLHARAYKSSDMGSQKKFPSKSCTLRYGAAKIQEDAFNLFQSGLREFLGSNKIRPQGTQCNGWRVIALSVSASRIFAIPSGAGSITKYFSGQDLDFSTLKQSHNKFIEEAVPSLHLGSGQSLQMSLTEQNMESIGEEATLKDFVPCVDQLDRERISRKDEEPTCSSSMPADSGLAQDTSLLSPSGSESCLELIETGLRMELPREGLRSKRPLPSLKQEELERSTSKVKETSSIRRFFRSCNTSPFPSQDPATIVDATGSSSSGLQLESSSCSEVKQAEVPKESPLVEPGTSCGSCNAGQDGQRNEMWGSYQIDEIDHSVVDELPLEIRQEIQAWLQPQKRANISKRGSGTARYFLPSTQR